MTYFVVLSNKCSNSLYCVVLLCLCNFKNFKQENYIYIYILLYCNVHLHINNVVMCIFLVLRTCTRRLLQNTQIAKCFIKARMSGHHHTRKQMKSCQTARQSRDLAWSHQPHTSTRVNTSGKNKLENVIVPTQFLSFIFKTIVDWNQSLSTHTECLVPLHNGSFFYLSYTRVVFWQTWAE